MTPADLTSRRVGAVVSSLWSAAAWRATRNDLAALLVATVATVLLGVLGVLWGAAVYSLLNWPVGGPGHVALYLTMVIAGPVLALWAVQGLTALQRSRLRAVAGVDIPGSSGAAAGLAAACWLAPAAAIAYLVAGHPSAAAGAVACAAAVVLLFAAPWLAK